MASLRRFIPGGLPVALAAALLVSACAGGIADGVVNTISQAAPVPAPLPGVGETEVSSSFLLDITGASSPASVQADVDYDASRYSVVAVDAGGAADKALKSVSWSKPADGKVRIMVWGGDQPLESGTLAKLNFIDKLGAGDSPVLSVSDTAAVDASASTLDAVPTTSGMEVR